MAKGASKLSDGGKIEGVELNSLTEAEEFFTYEWYNSLSSTERIVIYEYTDTGYKDINSYLRTGKGGTKEITDAVNIIDTAITKSIIKEPVVVNRGCSGAMFGFPANHIPTQAELQRFVGRSFKDNGFVSTSAGQTPFLDAVTLKITVPAGKGRGGYIGIQSAHSSESELLLRRGARYRVTGVDSKGVVSIQML